MYPYLFPNGSTDFDAAIPQPGGNQCTNLNKAIITFPVLVANFVKTFLDTAGKITPTFLSMIYEPGDLKAMASVTSSNVWLLCNGQEVPKSQYPDLFAKIGSVWGTATNPNNFKLPNLSGRVAVGVGTFPTSGSAVNLGTYGGEENHQLVLSETPSFTATAQVGLVAAGGTDKVFNGANGTGSSVNGLGIGDSGVGNRPKILSEQISISNGGGNLGHNNIQPYAGVNMYIFAGVPAS